MNYVFVLVTFIALAVAAYLFALLRVSEAKRRDLQDQLPGARSRPQGANDPDALRQHSQNIAHELNNLLTSILGNAELLMDKSASDKDFENGLIEIKTAGTRAAASTRELLAVRQPVGHDALPDDSQPIEAQQCCETILVVDDDEQVLRFVEKGLSSLGFRVLTASGGEAGIEICKTASGPIHAILSDVIMSGTNGPAFMDRARRLHPNAAAIYISSYDEDIVLWRRKVGRQIPLVTKPFELQTLARVVRDQLDGQDASQSSPGTPRE